MSKRIFRELPPVDPELIEALKRADEATEEMTGAAFIRQTPTHLGHHYGPVHPDIMPYTPVEKERP